MIMNYNTLLSFQNLSTSKQLIDQCNVDILSCDEGSSNFEANMVQSSVHV